MKTEQRRLKANVDFFFLKGNLSETLSLTKEKKKERKQSEY